MTLFAITGANGFIGRHLVASLAAKGERVRALTRQAPNPKMLRSGIEWVVGDISDRDTWTRLVEPGCIVINLAYSNTSAASTAIDATAEMIEGCAKAHIAHLIHCSTVSVYGRARETRLTEQSACNPLDDYGLIKLRVEQALINKVQGRFPVTIVRPSAVFGEGGEALIKLVEELTTGMRLINYLRSSMFGRRKTHLVPVETVVAALIFLSEQPPPDETDMFIVSNDDDPFNNFRNVEQVLMAELNVSPYPVKQMPIPRVILQFMMRMMGRANINTSTEYRGDRLASRGFVKPVTLQDALRRFATTHKKRQRKDAA